jgi:hypothetical protein
MVVTTKDSDYKESYDEVFEQVKTLNEKLISTC